MAGPVVGVDLGATAIKAGLVEPDGRIRARAECPTHGSEGADAVLDRVAALVQALLSGGPGAVGVGSCGLVDHRGRVVETTATMPGWDGTDIPAEVKRRTGLPCVADNDGNAAALAEALVGAGRGYHTVAMLTLGTGVGGGLVVDGRVVHGAGSMAGTFGHLKVAAGGRLCACGARGCLEAYASAWAFRQATGRAPHEVFADARTGDRASRRLVRQAAVALGTALADIGHAVNPDLVVIGGGMAAGWPQLAAAALTRFRQAALKRTFATTQVTLAALGPDAGIVGAALLTRSSRSQV
jgi:glucokinase